MQKDQIAAGFARIVQAMNTLSSRQSSSSGGGVPANGAAGQLLAKLSGDDFDAGWVDPPAGSTMVVQDFTVPGTSLWVKPAGKKYHKLEMTGWGGPGGGGSALATTSARFGGGPGSGAQQLSVLFLDDELPSSVSVVVGVSPIVGANALSSAGSNGTKGGDCRFGNLSVVSGNPGFGGSSTSGSTGASTTGGIPMFVLTGQAGQPARVSGVGEGGANFSGCTGGGGGGGAPAGPGIAAAGRKAIAANFSGSSVAAGPGVQGSTISYGGRDFGMGGGGGAYTPGAPGTNGADGGFPGGGGGGGGASDAGFYSGLGGQGGGACIRIKSW